MNCQLLSSMFVLTALVSVGGAQQLPPVRPLGPVLSTSTEPMASVSQVRALPGGRVLVHDLTGRRVLLYDSTFKHFTVIADTTSATGNAYGSRLGGLIAARGDTSLFVDPTSMSMLVIDGNGKIVRSIAVPEPDQVNGLIGGPNGTPGVDPQGRLVYRGQSKPSTSTSGPGAAPAGAQMSSSPESSLVMRVDLKTRKVDTLASFRIPKISMNTTRDENTNSLTFQPTVNAMPWTDDWALLADGTIAIVRGQDYRVDLLGLNGKMTTGAKLPFEWQRLSDEDKSRIIDSARTVEEKRPQGDAGGFKIIPGRGPRAPKLTMAPLGFVSIDQMPDYRPAFRQGAARGDADGNLWVRTSQMVNGGTVYDVISNKGELKDRILIPPGRVIAGFGPVGVVYMGVVDGDITHLERARAPVVGTARP
jgi:hypothetical protein